MGGIYGWGLDPMYLLSMIPGLLITIWAQARVQRTFNTYNNVPTMQGLTGAQATRRILDMNSLLNLKIGRLSGSHTNQYGPGKKVQGGTCGFYGRARVHDGGVGGQSTHHCGQYDAG